MMAWLALVFAVALTAPDFILRWGWRGAHHAQ